MLYVVYVQGVHALNVLEQLRLKNITAYCPRQLYAERKRGEWQYIERIIFGGYVFVDIPVLTAEFWHEIKSCTGVIRFVSCNPLPNGEDEYIRCLCNSGECIELSRGYIIDNELHITDGFLKQYEHRIIKFNRRGKRATADVTMYGKHYRVVFSIEYDNPPANA